jgi:hypothetical protein
LKPTHKAQSFKFRSLKKKGREGGREKVDRREETLPGIYSPQ